jgi:hypothetical protein
MTTEKSIAIGFRCDALTVGADVRRVRGEQSPDFVRVRLHQAMLSRIVLSWSPTDSRTSVQGRVG